MKVKVFIWWGLLGLFSLTFLQGEPGTGLEVDNYRDIVVLVENLNPAAEALGLTAGGIEDRVELRLRAAGVTPTSEYLTYYLYVNVGVTGNAFTIAVNFSRLVLYFAGDTTYRTVGATWSTSVRGTFVRDSSAAATYILDRLDESVEEFLLEYLRTNQ
jgi:hypothetical protein